MPFLKSLVLNINPPICQESGVWQTKWDSNLIATEVIIINAMRIGKGDIGRNDLESLMNKFLKP